MRLPGAPAIVDTGGVGKCTTVIYCTLPVENWVRIFPGDTLSWHKWLQIYCKNLITAPAQLDMSLSISRSNCAFEPNLNYCGDIDHRKHWLVLNQPVLFLIDITKNQNQKVLYTLYLGRHIYLAFYGNCPSLKVQTCKFLWPCKHTPYETRSAVVCRCQKDRE